jgi:hypothetical protein
MMATEVMAVLHMGTTRWRDRPVDNRWGRSVREILLATVAGLLVFALAFLAAPLRSEDLETTTAAQLRHGDTAGATDEQTDVRMTGATPPQVASRVSPADTHEDPHDRGGHGDLLHAFLQDAAAARHAGPGPSGGETRTVLCINAPQSIGSTSPGSG